MFVFNTSVHSIMYANPYMFLVGKVGSMSLTVLMNSNYAIWRKFIRNFVQISSTRFQERPDVRYGMDNFANESIEYN